LGGTPSRCLSALAVPSIDTRQKISRCIQFAACIAFRFANEAFFSALDKLKTPMKTARWLPENLRRAVRAMNFIAPVGRQAKPATASYRFDIMDCVN